jgi:hypothetical protein
MPENEDCHALRQEILQLLEAQMQALEDSSRLSDLELSACYRRQEKVSELRDQLSIALKPKEELGPDCGDLSSAPIPSSTNSGPAIQAAVGM